MVENKEKQINFLAEEIAFKRIERDLQNLIFHSKIKSFESLLQKQICSDLPTTF